jgi:glycyl-tRNA synthetase beta subunit
VTVRRDFLVEIGTEELPPKSLLQLASSFADGIAQGLDAASLAHGTVERRHAAKARGARSAPGREATDRAIEKRGPPVKAALDAQGAPTCRARVRAAAASKSARWNASRHRRANGSCTVALRQAQIPSR